MFQDYEKLKKCLQEITDIGSVGSLLYWDQATYLPEQGTDKRSRQMALMSKMSHEKFTAKELGDWAESSLAYFEKNNPSGQEVAICKTFLEDYQRATRVPHKLVEEMTIAFSQSYQAWTKARAENDFKSVVPYLKKNLELSKAYAKCFSKNSEHPIDTLMSEADPGITMSEMNQIFTDLKKELPQIIQTYLKNHKSKENCLLNFYEKDKQLKFGLRVAKDIGYNFSAGRQDETFHPFMTRISTGDVRILTRVNENDFSDAFSGTVHEVGHALYEQNINLAWDDTPCATGASVGVHESQSRLWENLVAKSLSFWKYYYPILQSEFPENLKNISLGDFYKSMNQVNPALIRVDADEVTYNLHVAVRFEIEQALHEDTMQIEDLPQVWNQKYKEYLNVDVPDFKNGCMQDVHWFGGVIGGYFQGYTIGNILSAQFFNAACKAHPNISSDMEKGKFSDLLNWLKLNVHQYGKSKKPNEIILNSTGMKMTSQPYLNYLKNKYN